MLVPGLIDVIEAESVYAPIRRLADHVRRYARLIRLDKRGTGYSERLPADAAPSLEDRVDDVIAVMDAAGSERATVLGVADGGAVAIVLAVTHPERVSALVLNATPPRIAWSPEWPWGIPREAQDAGRRIIEEQWGTGVMAARFGFTDPEQREEIARLERLTSSPAAAARLIETFYSIDVREMLPAINVPTLVTHHIEHPVWPIEGARYVAANIPGARLVEFEGQPDGLGPAGGDDYLDLVQEMVTGARPSPSLDRVLKTVVFTDIVGSTERLTEVGDRRWSQLLDEHDAAVGRALDRFGGQRVNTTGDGYFAVFDGPARGSSVRVRSSPTPGASHSTCARACTLVSAKCAAMTTPAWPCTSGPGSARSRCPERCSSLPPCATSSLGRASSSERAGDASCGAFPASGPCLR